MNTGFTIQREKEKRIDDFEIEDNFRVFQRDSYIFDLSYKYLKSSDRNSSGHLKFYDLNLDLFCNYGFFSNGIFSSYFISPGTGTINSLIKELRRNNFKDLGLVERIKRVQDFFRTKDGEILDVFSGFINLKV